YRDAQAALEWLCRAFGFEKHLIVPGEGGTIAHAELSFGNGMIMLGSVKKSEFDRLMKQPDDLGTGGLRPRINRVRIRNDGVRCLCLSPASFEVVSGSSAATIHGEVSGLNRASRYRPSARFRSSSRSCTCSIPTDKRISPS